MTAKETLNRAMARHGISVTSEFVPFSKSRNATKTPEGFPRNPKPDELCLNWRVTLMQGGRAILTTDYQAGVGHAPAYKAPVAQLGGARSLMRWEALESECETGNRWHSNRYAKGAAILPDQCDVIYSLLLDSGVLDYADFESWAGDYGYSADSISAKAIYDSCLSIALNLQAGLGPVALAELRLAAQDY